MDLKVNHNLFKHVSKKLNRENHKLNLKNKKVFQFQMKQILTLKRSKLSDVDVQHINAKFNFLVNQDTFNSHQTIGYLLALIKTYQQAFPFLDIHLSHLTHNKVIVRFSWEDYRNALESDLLEKTLSDSSVPDLSLQERLPGVSNTNASLRELDLDNANRLQQLISKTLDQPKSGSMNAVSTDYQVYLRKNTFSLASSANFIRTKMLSLKREYPFIELYHLKGNQVILRVYWSLYYHLLTKGHQYSPVIPAQPDRPVRLEEVVEDDADLRLALQLSMQQQNPPQQKTHSAPVWDNVVIPPGYLAEHLTAEYLQEQKRSPYRVSGYQSEFRNSDLPPYGGLNHFPGYPSLSHY